MRIQQAWLLSLAIATMCSVSASSAAAQAAEVRGIAFVDANGNGVPDGGEKGLAGIAISNQDAVVLTDGTGAFHIGRGTTGVVFVSVPDGYHAEGTFWRSTAASARSMLFPLVAEPRRSDFSFVHASDTHISPASQERTRRLRAMVDSIHPDFILIAGDLVRDALRVSEPEARSYYDLFRTETKQFATPVWTVPGNHENFGIERELSHVDPSHPLLGRGMYRSYFGPDYYSFTRGGVHFVGLNTVDIADGHYYGHVDSLQLAWLARDLAQIPAAMPVVTFDHIPLASAFLQLAGYDDGPPAPSLITVKGKTMYRHTVSNADEVLSVLRTHRYVLALGAHIHAGEKLAFETDGVRTRFEQSPAIVGPSETAGLRFPSGFTLYTVHAGVIDSGRFVPLDCTGANCTGARAAVPR